MIIVRALNYLEPDVEPCATASSAVRARSASFPPLDPGSAELFLSYLGSDRAYGSAGGA